MAKSIFQESLKLTGLPGATAGSRYVGGTVAGAPTIGSFLVGDYIVDQTGATWVCITAGSPGVWNRTANAGNNIPLGYDQMITSFNPQAWWKLSDPVGSTSISDSSNNKYNGSVAGGYTFGQTGPITGTPSDTGLALNGTSGYAAVASPTPLGISNQLSIITWFKTTTSSGGTIGSYLDNNGWNYLQIGMNNNGTVSSTASAATVYQTITSTKSYNDGNWHFACATAIGSGQFAFYIDGILIGSTTLTTNFTFSTSNNYIELSIFYGSGYFNGSLAQYALFNTILNSNQIAGLYSAATAIPSSWALPINENIAGKNFIINGGMDIAQRGTSISVGASAITYTLDRWCAFSTSPTVTVSQISSGLTGFQYAIRTQRNSGQGAGTIYQSQSIETKNSIPLAGQTVTISFWARAGANYSQTGNGLFVELGCNTTTDANILNGGFAQPFITTQIITTSWVRYSYTTTIPSNATQVGFYVNETATGTAGANDYFDITGVQLEISNTATPFSRAGGSIGAELALCQRYYQRIGGSYYSPENVGVGTAGTTTAGYINCPTKQVLRTGASFNAVFGASSMKIANAGGSQFAMTSASLAITGTNAVLFSYNVASGLTAGQPVLCFITGTDAYIELNAEL